MHEERQTTLTHLEQIKSMHEKEIVQLRLNHETFDSRLYSETEKNQDLNEKLGKVSTQLDQIKDSETSLKDK
jgi:hypothetical protein